MTRNRRPPPSAPVPADPGPMAGLLPPSAPVPTGPGSMTGMLSATGGCKEDKMPSQRYCQSPSLRSCRQGYGRVAGFTLVELLVVMVVASILAFYAMGRMGSVGDVNAQGFAEEIASSLRFAQKAAVAQRRLVYVTIAAGSNHVFVCLDSASPCVNPLQQPSGGNLDFIGPASVTLTSNVSQFCYSGFGSPLASTGSPNGCNALTPINGALQVVATSPTGAQCTVTVQPDSGYVQRT